MQIAIVVAFNCCSFLFAVEGKLLDLICGEVKRDFLISKINQL